MSRISLRRALGMLAACASALVLSACGSSTTESALHPARLVVFGDAFADVGQNGAKYTVNDGSTNHWVQRIAERYELPLAASAAGGNGYAQASARITAKPDAAGSSTTLTVTEQIDRFLAAGAPGANDLVVVAGGMADLIVAGKAFVDGGQTEAQMVAQAEQAGNDLAAQVRRLVTAGTKHVVVVGPYDLALTPWGGLTSTDSNIAKRNGDALKEASRRFNDVFKVAVVDMGETVLYVDAAFYFNLLASKPSDYSLSNAAVAVCTSVDAGAGIGLGAGQVNSSLCTASTVLAGVDYNKYLYADAIYPTPYAQRLFGDYAYDRIRNRW